MSIVNFYHIFMITFKNEWYEWWLVTWFNFHVHENILISPISLRIKAWQNECYFYFSDLYHGANFLIC